MHPYARLTPGPGFLPHRAALYYTHRLIVWPLARDAVAHALAAMINVRQGYDRPGSAADEAVSSLRNTGFYRLPDLLSASEIAEIHDWLQAHQPHSSGAYSLDAVLNCPYVLRTMFDPNVLAIASGYLGCKPTLSSVGMRWSYCGTKPNMTQTFHRDPDDWKFVKVFVYLTDVTAESGPHVYVLGSHRTRSRLRGTSYTESDVERRYGAKAVLKVVGAAGTSFIADTYGIHRGEVPILHPRLILQMQYSILPNFALLYHPVAIRSEHAGIDPYIGRLVVA